MNKKRIIETVKPQLSHNALEVVTKRYLKTNKSGHPIETPAEMFYRVAKFMATADRNYLKKEGLPSMSKALKTVSNKRSKK